MAWLLKVKLILKVSHLLDYSSWFKREIWPFLKRDSISETGETTPTKIGFHAFHMDLYLHEFFGLILFFDPMDYSLWSERENLLFLRRTKRAISLKLERPHPPKLVSMHFTWTSTCMKFLGRFYFLNPMEPIYLLVTKAKLNTY